MAFLSYSYRMQLQYSEAVERCYFTIKAIPSENLRQKSLGCEISLNPETNCSRDKDSFGNQQIIGSICQRHDSFEYSIQGLVETGSGEISEPVNPSTVGMYKYPFGKCIPGKNLSDFAKELEEEVERCSSEREKCFLLMHRIYERMVYVPGSTEISTTAEEAFSAGTGVCQDYAHIYITLLRWFRIPARYVCGLIAGEGASHAWVEAVIDQCYVGFDPTHDRSVTEEYISFGTGRDYWDCAINRGVMWGGGCQTQQVHVKVNVLCP